MKIFEVLLERPEACEETDLFSVQSRLRQNSFSSRTVLKKLDEYTVKNRTLRTYIFWCSELRFEEQGPRKKKLDTVHDAYNRQLYMGRSRDPH